MEKQKEECEENVQKGMVARSKGSIRVCVCAMMKMMTMVMMVMMMMHETVLYKLHEPVLSTRRHCVVVAWPSLMGDTEPNELTLLTSSPLR